MTNTPGRACLRKRERDNVFLSTTYAENLLHNSELLNDDKSPLSHKIFVSFSSSIEVSRKKGGHKLTTHDREGEQRLDNIRNREISDLRFHVQHRRGPEI